MTDKTMKNEPVRLVSSAAYLRQWIDLHPFRDESESPIWVDLLKIKKGKPIALNYHAIASMTLFVGRSHPDHVHLFIQCPPKYPISYMAKKIKGKSSRLAPSNYHGSVGAGWDVVDKYISAHNTLDKKLLIFYNRN